MLMISADVLALSSEAAVLVRAGRIQFANSAAKAILGEGCVGSTVKSVFGVEIAEAQAASFVGDLPIGGVRYIIRVTSMEGVRAVFLTKHEESAALINGRADLFTAQLPDGAGRHDRDAPHPRRGGQGRGAPCGARFRDA